jgi:hypothetical protein
VYLGMLKIIMILKWNKRATFNVVIISGFVFIYKGALHVGHEVEHIGLCNECTFWVLPIVPANHVTSV